MSDANGDMAQAAGASPTAPVAAPEAPPASSGQPSNASATTEISPSQTTTTFADRLRQGAKDQSGTDPKLNAGPIPFDRHEKILTDARKESAEKAVAEYRTSLGWNPDTVPHETIRRYAELDQAIAADPVQVAFDLMTNAAKNPKWQAKIKSLAARTLSGRPTQPTAPVVDDAMPGPDTEQGYSPAGLQKLLDWNEARALTKARAEFQKELDPFRSVAETFETQRKSAEREQYLDSRTKDLSAQIQKLPLAKEHEDAIAKVFLGLHAKNEAELVANMYRAYHEVVDPVREGSAQQAAMKALSTQAAANSARPTNGKAGVVVKSQPVRFGQALREAAAAASR